MMDYPALTVKMASKAYQEPMVMMVKMVPQEPLVKTV
jgi:hypothetical protein